jgi:hypothetical protein
MPETPTLPEVMQQIFDEYSNTLRKIEPGEVTAWDKSNQTATIQPLVRARTGEDRPLIYKVPVLQPIAYQDVQVGEVGLLLICDKNPSKWWRDNQQSDPEGTATHTMTNAIFLPGLRSRDDARTVPTDTTVLEKPTAGGEVHLGVQGATKAAVHEEFLSNFSTFLTELSAWATATGAVTGIAWNLAGYPGYPGPGPVPPVGRAVQMPIDITAGDYESPSVKVED